MKIDNATQTLSLIRTSKLQTPKEMFEVNNAERKGVLDKTRISDAMKDTMKDALKGNKLDTYS